VNIIFSRFKPTLISHQITNKITQSGTQVIWNKGVLSSMGMNGMEASKTIFPTPMWGAN
jgi:hypothetical protein